MVHHKHHASVKNHSGSFVKAFFPIKLFLLLTAQLPFTIRKHKDATYEFVFSLCNCSTLMFAIISILYGGIFLLISAGFVAVPIGLGEIDKTFKIRAKTFTTNQTLPCSRIYLLTHGRKYVHYWNFWNRSLQTININPTKGVQRELCIKLLTFVVFTVCECCIFGFLPGTRAVAGVFCTMATRFIVPGFAGYPYFKYAQIVVYGHVGSRAIIMQFVFFVKLLKNTSEQFNSRLQNGSKLYLKREPKIARAKREAFQILLKDHLIIVQLYKMTDNIFGTILRAYFISQLASTLFGLFYLWKLLGPDETQVQFFIDPNSSSIIQPQVFNILKMPTKDQIFEDRVNKWEVILTMLLFLQTLASCFLTTSYANDACSALTDGYKTVRHRGLIGCRTKSERNFTYNLEISYGHIEPVNAEGYFTITKSLFAGMILSICGFFVICIQFKFPRYNVLEKDYLLGWATKKS